MAIYGGRNNKDAFDEVKNIALNDLNLLDLETRTWTVISILGEVPSSRWGHSMATNDETLYIFGGKNMLSFAKA